MHSGVEMSQESSWGEAEKILFQKRATKIPASTTMIRSSFFINKNYQLGMIFARVDIKLKAARGSRYIEKALLTKWGFFMG